MAAKPQFSLQWIFAATAAVALVLGEAVAFPGWLAAVVGVAATSFLVPAFMAGIVYSRGQGRAFCIGALAWWFAIIWLNFSFGIPKPGQEVAWLHQFYPNGSVNASALPHFDKLGREYRFDYCILWSLTLAGGLVAVFIRWLTMPKATNNSPRSGDGI
jgi:hypothetical protein